MMTCSAFCLRVIPSVCILSLIAAARADTQSLTLIRNVRIFDGERMVGEGVPGDVVIAEGLIRTIGRDLTVRSDDPLIYLVVDAAGGFLMPGMIDSHTHTFDVAMLQQELVFGVTTTMDMFTAAPMLASMRATAGHRQADIFSSGVLVTAPGGHGTQFGVPIPTITSPDEAQQFVDDRIGEGADYIKIVYDAGKAYGREIPTISRETLKAVIDAAHERDKLAVVHIGDQQSAVEAIEAGADALVHTFVDEMPREEFGELVKASGAFIVPTLTVLEGLDGRPSGEALVNDEFLAPYIPSASAANLKRTFPGRGDGDDRVRNILRATIVQLRDAGVPILAGTDAPNPGTAHGVSMHRELELLVEMGLEPIEALRAATSRPAAVFDLADRGRIAKGLKADLLLVEGDPTVNILDTRKIIAVWKDGILVDREGHRLKLAAARERAHQGDRGEALGLVSAFEEQEIAAQFGSGWEISTDQIMGGQSVAEMNIVPEGARGSRGALEISGEIKVGGPFPWAGAMFYPGDQPFAPRNISAKKSISFYARGDGGTYRIMIFAESLGTIPAWKMFAAPNGWVQYQFDLSLFNGVDGSDLTGVLFTGGPAIGAFKFQIDDVQFE